jgi:PAS domain S-box-containing protein
MMTSASPELVRALFDHSPLPQLVFDRETLAFLDVNEAALRHYGYTRAEFLEMTVLELRPAEEVGATGAASGAASARPAGTGGVWRHVKKDGAAIEVEVMTADFELGRRPVRLATVRDLTEERRAIDALRLNEQALRRSEESFRAAIESAPDLVFVLRGARLVYVNAAVLSAVGRCRDELLGRGVLALVHPGDRERAREALRRATEDPAQVSVELRLVRGDGEVLRVEFRGVAVAFDGEPAVLAFGRDVTTRRLLEARLAAADRMSSLGELAAGVAHEINNPVSYALANVVFAGEVVEPLLPAARPDDARELIGALRDARQGLERVRDIVRDLKTFSRSDGEGFRPIDLYAALEAACSMSRNEVKHRAQLVQRFQRGSWVRGDEGKLAQVFVNLLVNAAQAIPDGHADENVVSIGVLPWPGGWIAVEVCDTGQGIAAQHLPRLFDPFFTTKPKGLGTGLGLSICHSIVRAHAGRIEVETSPGEGSCFRVLLPGGAPRGEQEAPRPTPSPAGGQRGHVLVVDDEPRVCDALVRLIGAEHDLRAVTSSWTALELFRAGERFDAVLCDVMMPEMTGVQLHRAVAELAPEQARRFAFMTGGVFSGEARRLLEQSGRPVVPKPFDREALLACLRALCEGAAPGAPPA